LTTYILVSGAWHAGWCWERVVPQLEAGGHRAIAPDLIGMGQDHTPLSTVTLAKWADQIAAIIREQDEPVVLAGHSRGGIIISEVAERVPQHIATLAYLAAFLVESGETLMSTATKLPRERPVEISIAQEGGTTLVRPEALDATFYNMTESAWVDRARSLVSAEPMAAFTTPLSLTDEKYGSVKRAYIECINDYAIPLALQRIMQDALPCSPVFTLETDHSPFYSAPDELSACLQKIG